MAHSKMTYPFSLNGRRCACGCSPSMGFPRPLQHLAGGVARLFGTLRGELARVLNPPVPTDALRLGFDPRSDRFDVFLGPGGDLFERAHANALQFSLESAADPANELKIVPRSLAGSAERLELLLQIANLRFFRKNGEFELLYREFAGRQLAFHFFELGDPRVALCEERSNLGIAGGQCPFGQ